MSNTEKEPAIQVLWADLASAIREELTHLPWQTNQPDVSKITVLREGSLDPDLTISANQARENLLAVYRDSQSREQAFEIVFLENGDSANFKSSDRLVTPAFVASELLKPLLS
jgi:hypothetical protein